MLPVSLTDTISRDFARAVHYTLHWGLEGVVLRSLGDGMRVPDVNERKLDRLVEHELPIVAVDPGLFEAPATERAIWLNDLERLRETLAFAGRVGCPRVITGALPGGGAEAAASALRQASERADAAGAVLLVRNEGEGRATAADLAGVLGTEASAALQACWDPAAALEAGEEAAEGLERLAGRIGMVMVRDGAAASVGWERRPLGEGEVGWGEVFAGLRRTGFDGPVCLDLGGVPSKEGLQEATAMIQSIRQSRVRR